MGIYRNLLASIGASLLLAVNVHASADWSDWQLYENSHFRVYSDAKEKKVTKLLEELEKFHNLVQSALSTSIPANAPKTIVFLFKRRKAFKQYTWHNNLGGFMTSVDGIPVIVMPVSQRGLESEQVIRHEYVHVAQSYGNKVYPKWLNEGMAELLSTVKYQDNYGLVGHFNKKRWQHLSTEFSYNQLIKDDFDGLKRKSGADAYAQYWVLTVYSLAHDDGVYRDELGKYIALYRKGGDSLESFKTAYGRSPNDFAREAMRNFKRRSYSYNPLVWEMDVTQMDLTPSKVKADEETLIRLTTVFKNRTEKNNKEKN